MRNLLNFLLKYNYWLLFIFLEVICFVLLFRFNNYQQSVFFTSANAVAGKIYEVSGGISSYFHLKSVNEDLLDRNMALEQQITNLESQLKDYRIDSMTMNSIRNLEQADYQIFKAHVIHNSLNQADNYITLDKGSSSGIRPEMGVVDGSGVVGIVYKTSPSYSLVISVLNSKSSISCNMERYINLVRQTFVEATKQCATTRQINTVVDDIGIQLRRCIFQCAQYGRFNLGD